MKTIKVIKTATKIIIRLIAASAAVGIILVVVYFLGHQLLEGYYNGNDNSWGMLMADWVNRWWPHVPWWYPAQGAGESVMLGYLSFIYNFVVGLNRFSSLTLTQAQRLVQALSIPIIALEIYFYTWWLTKKQTPALLAAIFYPLSPIAWFWITDIGIYAMSVSIIFFLPALWTTQAFRKEVIEGRVNTTKARVLLLLSAIAIALSLISHTAVGMGFLAVISLETLFNMLLVKYEGIKRGQVIIRSILGVGLALVSGLALSSFVFYSVLHYFKFALSEIPQTWSSEAVPTINLTSFLGLSGLLGKRWILNSGSDFLVPVVTIWAILGSFLYLLKRKAQGTLGLTLFILAFYISVDRWFNDLGGFFPKIVLTTNIRLYGPLFICFPIVAAVGVWGLSDVPASIFRWIGKKIKIFKYVGIALGLVTIVLSFTLSLGSVYYLRNSLVSTKKYEGEQDKSELGAQLSRYYYGPSGLQIAWCAIPHWQEKPIENCLPPLPPFQISKEGRDFLADGTVEKYNKKLGWDQFTRIDITPNMGQLISLFSIHSDASTIVSYGAQAIANPLFRGYQGNIYYSPGLEAFQEEQVDQLARWFGISHLWITKGEAISLASLYSKEKWQDVITNAPEGGNGVIKEFYQPTDYATVSTKPKVLVIGDYEKRNYEQIFRFSARGGLPYQEFLLIKGPLKVDQLSLKEMKQYQVLVLHGANYKNRTRAWNLLAQYVHQGGRVYLDSGWQYVSGDWGLKQEVGKSTFITEYPDPSPVKKTTWSNLGTSWEGGKLEIKNLDLQKFAPPIWENKPWSMAVADINDLNPDSKPILSKGDKIVIAQREYGQGRFIWSGMNLIAHGYDKENEEEMKLFHELLTWLTKDLQGKDLKDVIKTERTNPDQVTFKFLKERPTGGLIWREFWTPDWKATLVKGKRKQSISLDIAGPGLMFVNLSQTQIKAGDKIILNYKPPIWVGQMISVIALILLLIAVIEMAFFKGKITKAITSSIPKQLKQRKTRIKEGIKKSWDDEDY